MLGTSAFRVADTDTNITKGIFKDTYIFEFLSLKETHDEPALQKGLISNMKDFILEMGRDLLFIGQEYF